MSYEENGPQTEGPLHNQTPTKSAAEALMQAAITSGSAEAKSAALQIINSVDAANGNHELGAWAVGQLKASLPKNLKPFSGMKSGTIWAAYSETAQDYGAVAIALQAPGVEIHHPTSQEEFDEVHTAICGYPYQGWNEGRVALIESGEKFIVHLDFTQAGSVDVVMGVLALSTDFTDATAQDAADTSSFVKDWNDWPWLPGAPQMI